MCGRYTLGRQPNSLLDYFHLHGEVPVYHLSWNITPSQMAPVVLQDTKQGSGAGRVCQLMRWGLVPGWSKGPDPRYNMINAKAETIDQKPAYKNAFSQRRCLIPCDGFYEWHAVPEHELEQKPEMSLALASEPASKKNTKKKNRIAKQPYYIYKNDDSLLALAGIWEQWASPDASQQIDSFSIITTDANPFMQNIHHRMPVILSPDQFDTWLSEQHQASDQLKSLLVPYQGDDLAMHTVSKAVNSPKNDGIELTEAVEA